MPGVARSFATRQARPSCARSDCSSAMSSPQLSSAEACHHDDGKATVEDIVVRLSENERAALLLDHGTQDTVTHALVKHGVSLMPDVLPKHRGSGNNTIA